LFVDCQLFITVQRKHLIDHTELLYYSWPYTLWSHIAANCFVTLCLRCHFLW